MWLSERASNSDGDAVHTDAEGRWTIDDAPSGDDVQVRLMVTHPAYTSDKAWGGLQKRQGVDTAALRARTATITMPGGVRAVGTVVDPDGKPVAGAVVVRGDRPYWEHGSQEVLTDDRGAFRLPALPPGEVRITVVAEGWMPESRIVSVEPDMGAIDFRLRRGVELLVRVVDRAGAPVSGATLGIQSWRGSEALYNHDHPNVMNTHIPRSVDDAGLFRWTWAPDDAVSFQLYKHGYSEQDVTLTADGREQTVVLNSVRRISGTVTDDRGKPVEGATVMPVLEFRPGFLHVERSAGQALNGSEYTIEATRTDVSYRVRAEAPGYRAAMSDVVHAGEPDPRFDFRLGPAPPIQGRILSGGRPVAGATVHLATASQCLDIGRGTDASNRDGAKAQTDADGGFRFPAQFEPFAVVAVHADGYAEVECEADGQPGDLPLKPWMRVEGRVMQTDRPIASNWVRFEPIRAQGGDSPRFQEHYEVETGQDGRFVLAQVPPVQARVRAYLSVWRDSPLTSGRSIPLEPAPGGRVDLELGGRGASIVGRVAPQGGGEVELPKALNYLVRKTPGVEPPPALRGIGFDAAKGWNEAWANTAEGQAFLGTLDHHFVKLDVEGRFRVEGVAPGEYDLAIRLYEPPKEGCLVSPVGVRVVPIRVEGADIELGDVAVETVRAPRVGEPAPDFSFTTFGGEPVKLADLRGRYVLLDFWASWCAPCVAGFPVLQRIHDEHATDGRLTILGLSLDDDPDAARRFVQTRKSTWMQGTPGADVRSLYAVGGVPAYFLIGPDGNLAHVGSSVEEVEQAVRGLMK